MSTVFLGCTGQVGTFNGAPTCSTDWAIYTSADIIGLGVNSSLPSPESMLLAFGAGIAVMLPLYGALWGIRAARDSIKQA